MTEPAYLLDANICIYLLGGLSERARRRVEQLQPSSIATSAIAFAEVMRGVDASDPGARQAADAFFSVCPVLSFGRDAALRYRSVPFRRAAYDRLIAAHALSLGLTFVTNNERDFVDIPGLRVENWTR